jgi:phage gp37-like protein
VSTSSTPTTTTIPPGAVSATALYDFHGSSANELSFSKGASILVTAQLDGGWWRGRLAHDGAKLHEAHFPEVYVKIDQLAASAPNNPVSPRKSKEKRTAALAASAQAAAKSAALAATATAGGASGAGGLRARALFDFSGATSAELSFKVGDMIVDVVCLEGEWWRGRFASRLGHFPHTYVELVVPRGDAATVAVLAAAAAAIGGTEPLHPPPAKLESAKGSKLRARAKFAYHGLTATELSFAAGDIIADVVCLDGEWWRGRFRGQLGHYPATWVELLPNSESAVPLTGPPALTKREKSSKQLAQLAGLTVSAEAPVPFTPTSPRLTEMIASMSAAAAAQKTAPVEHRRHKAFRARAIKRFIGTDATHLTFEDGNEIVVVAERDDGWWRGVLHAKEGLFPADCVQALMPLEAIATNTATAAAVVAADAPVVVDSNSSSNNSGRPKKKKKRADADAPTRKKKSLRRHGEGGHKKRSSKDAATIVANGGQIAVANNGSAAAAVAAPASVTAAASKDSGNSNNNTDDDIESESLHDSLPPTPSVTAAAPEVVPLPTATVVASPAAANDLTSQVTLLEEQNRALREEMRVLRLQQRRASIDNSTLSPRGAASANHVPSAHASGSGGTSGSATLRAVSASKSSSLAAAAAAAAAAKDPDYDASRTTSLFSNEMALDSKLQVRIVDIERRLSEQRTKSALHLHHSGLALEYSRIEMAYHALRRRVDEATQALDTIDSSSLAERVKKNPFLSRDKKSLRSTTTKQ